MNDDFYDWWLEKGTRDCRLQSLVDIVPEYKHYKPTKDYITKSELTQILKDFKRRLTLGSEV